MTMWNGKKKALTFSYDDAVSQDIRLIEIFNRYGLKCTFNMNSELLGMNGTLIRDGVEVTHYKNKPACPSPPELAVVAAHLTSLSRGFRIGNTVYSVFKARKKTPLTYQEVSGANVLPLTEIFSKYFS